MDWQRVKPGVLVTNCSYMEECLLDTDMGEGSELRIFELTALFPELLFLYKTETEVRNFSLKFENLDRLIVVPITD